jgi:hypothetical protein
MDIAKALPVIVDALKPVSEARNTNNERFMGIKSHTKPFKGVLKGK